MNFKYDIPDNVIFGRGRVNEIGKIASKHGKKAFIITGKNSSKRSGLLGRVETYLKESNIEFVIFNKLINNCDINEVENAYEFARYEKCNIIIGIGGGSSLDFAKMVCWLSSKKEEFPLILIPTTCGSGSEANKLIPIIDLEKNSDNLYEFQKNMKIISIIDSECMMTMSRVLLCITGSEVFFNNIIVCIASKDKYIKDRALYALKMTEKHLLLLYNGNDDPNSWDKITFASLIAGMGNESISFNKIYMMIYTIQKHKNIDYGKCMAAIIPSIIEEIRTNYKDEYLKIARIFEDICGDSLTNYINQFMNNLNLNIKISACNLEKEDIKCITKKLVSYLNV
ncbi:alcohol dehydrogenase [Clostridium butyricum]|uniref:Alcohol dehydrogenase n=1 Tax=Clostridium butyricum TaxID=1492 RepID=A0A512TM12_CLOBU|nr:iron-containing alcohol dehydrogenase [Clostridium butyricum]NAS18497.1 iron-containing alcohol dehydrogenase [Clostridium butyricum]NOW24427.1 alcohol dehydrogenase class IV [Clostridium butyricum]GEQ21255.1 alcohol dehydrogenase [Clostridium butyricum]